MARSLGPNPKKPALGHGARAGPLIVITMGTHGNIQCFMRPGADREVALIPEPETLQPSSINWDKTMTLHRGSRSNSLRSMENDDIPFAKPWWFHSSPLSFDDPLAPLPKSALDEGTWKPFLAMDCKALEESWQKLQEKLKQTEDHDTMANTSIHKFAFGSDDTKDKEEPIDETNRHDINVIVGVEQLHYVNVFTLKCSLWPRD